MPKEIKYGHYEGTSTTPYLDRTKTLYTQEELDKAVKNEREACLKEFNLYMDLDGYSFEQLERTIRARNK